MLQKLKPAAWMVITLIGFIGVAGIAWQDKPVNSNRDHFRQDTTPKKEKEDKTIITGDIDSTIEEVNRAKENLENHLQNKNWEKMQKDMLKVQAELKNSIEKIQRELEKTKEKLMENEGSVNENMERAREDINRNLKKDFIIEIRVC
ncbi:MAG: hypothetical protein NVSMB7_03090 [Chitinophagaceae bacterium]